jgi:hypothetical protein
MDRDVYGTNLKRHGRLITRSWLRACRILESSAFQDRRIMLLAVRKVTARMGIATVVRHSGKRVQ